MRCCLWIVSCCCWIKRFACVEYLYKKKNNTIQWRKRMSQRQCIRSLTFCVWRSLLLVFWTKRKMKKILYNNFKPWTIRNLHPSLRNIYKYDKNWYERKQTEKNVRNNTPLVFVLIIAGEKKMAAPDNTYFL